MGKEVKPFALSTAGREPGGVGVRAGDMSVLRDEPLFSGEARMRFDGV